MLQQIRFSAQFLHINDLYAVTEAPRYGQVEEQAFSKIEVADYDRYTWGVIKMQRFDGKIDVFDEDLRLVRTEEAD